MKTRLMTTFVLFLLLLSTGLFVSEAAPFPSITFTLDGTRICNAQQFAIMGEEHHQLKATSPQYSAVATLNGNLLNTWTGTWFSSGTGDESLAGFIEPQVFTPGSDTYSYHRTLTYAYNHRVFERVDFSFNCVAGSVQNVALQYNYQSGPFHF